MSKTRLTYFASCLGMALAMTWASGCSAPATNDPQGTGGSSSSAGTTGNGGNGSTAGTTGNGGNGATAGTTGNGGNPGTGGSISTAGTTGSAGNAAGTTGSAGRGGTTGSAGTVGSAGTTGSAGRGGTTGSAGTTGTAGTTGAAGTGVRMDQAGVPLGEGGRHDQRDEEVPEPRRHAPHQQPLGLRRAELQRHAAVRHGQQRQERRLDVHPSGVRRRPRRSRLPRGRVRRRAVRHDQLAADDAGVLVDDPASDPAQGSAERQRERRQLLHLGQRQLAVLGQQRRVLDQQERSADQHGRRRLRRDHHVHRLAGQPPPDDGRLALRQERDGHRRQHQLQPLPPERRLVERPLALLQLQHQPGPATAAGPARWT